MRPYYMDDIPGDQDLPHDSGIPVGIEVLASLGLNYTYVPVPDPITDDFPEIDVISQERGYFKRDWLVVTREALGDGWDAKMRAFNNEHLHEEGEIRYVVEGGGFFDLREHPTDRWIRCEVSPGDLVVVPPGIYHRFTLDREGQYIKALMLFDEEPRGSYENRGEASDINPYRKNYLKSIEAH